MTKVKICGLKTLQDIETANRLRPDYVGFVFAPGRRRTVSFETARRMRDALLPKIPAVGVFVDAPVEEVAGLLKDGTIQMAQLHGGEDEAYVARLRSLSDKPLIKAFVIRSKEDMERAAHFPCDYLLLDGGLGEGTVFDWSLIRETKKAVFLAGGLRADNVREAIAAVHPYCVDVSSGVETDGVKDEAKIKEFLETVRKE